MKNALLVLIVVFFAVLGASAQTTDAQSLNLVTSPIPINLITQPGSVVTADLRVKNGGTTTQKLRVGLMKFTAFGEEGKPKLVEREKGDDFFDWVSFSEDSFDISPNQWKTITMTINVPQDAAFGYYYAVTYSPLQQKITGPRKTTIVGSTATLVLLEVRAGNAKRDVEVSEFSTDKLFNEFLPVGFKVRLKNKGNVHVAPRGNIFISQRSGKNLAVVEVNPEKGNLLPNSNRIFNSKWDDGFPYYAPKLEDNKQLHDKKGRPVSFLKWDFSKADKIRWGRYTANMLLVYDDGSRDQAIEGSLSFWVVPWRILAGILIVISLVLIGLRSTVANVLRRVKK